MTLVEMWPFLTIIWLVFGAALTLAWLAERRTS